MNEKRKFQLRLMEIAKERYKFLQSLDFSMKKFMKSQSQKSVHLSKAVEKFKINPKE